MNIKEKFEEQPVVYCFIAIISGVAIIIGILYLIFPVSIGYYKDKFNDCDIENNARLDSIVVLSDSIKSLTAFIRGLEVRDYDSLIATYDLAVGDSIMAFNNLGKIKVMSLEFDEFKNKDIIGLQMSFVFYTSSKFIDAEYKDSIVSSSATYSPYNAKLAKNKEFLFRLASGNRYKCKLTDITNRRGKTSGTIEFYQILRKKN